ncbi:hypothetical protein [uncultured Thiodictyon sp.]|uniref:hypothetical protein n=1 Tax=uncultured Thiodictyon sp. TaxID=1846217 RepID=UPI0025F6DE3A|nr:hypothetical protein [uncultured Thiodictyon sp.]
MLAIEIDTEIDENSEIHIKLPRPQCRGPARVIVLLDVDQAELAAPKKHRPSPRLAFKGAQLHGDDLAPALTPSEWGELYQ